MPGASDYGVRRRGRSDLPADEMKINFFGNFGSLNSGNESTLLAIEARLRALIREPEFCCICPHPEAVAARDGIAATRITNREVRIWNRDVRLHKRVALAFIGVSDEVRQYARAFRQLKGTDMFIVPGTGLLTDAWGLSSWGPYSLFKWVLMAKLGRCKVFFVSVGAGPIDRPLGRLLVRSALRLADYRSYRDDSSKSYLRGIGFRAERDPVYPDLVFGLPDSFLSLDADRSERRRPVVGLGLMVYAGKYSATDPSPETYKAYLEALAVFAEWLLEHDYDIRLLLGDEDTRVIQEFRSVLRARRGSHDEARIVTQPITSVQDVLAELAATDVVVATRFHNVLLALLLNKPVIAISFHHKCSSLMSSMKLSDYCHDIDEIDADRLIGQFQRLEENRADVTRTITEGVEQARSALDEQYDLLFAKR